MLKKNSFTVPICILNIGGISNITVIKDKKILFTVKTLDHGNCLIDNWIRNNSSKKFDNKRFANGIVHNDIIFEQSRAIFKLS